MTAAECSIKWDIYIKYAPVKHRGHYRRVGRNSVRAGSGGWQGNTISDRAHSFADVTNHLFK